MTDAYQDEQEPGKFLRRKVGEGADRFVLYAISAERERIKLDQWPAGDDVEELRDLIEARASSHAQMGPTVCDFWLDAFEKKESMGCVVFRVAAEAPGLAKTLVSEPANEAGLVSLSMRHAEASVRALLTMSARTFEAQQRQIESASLRATKGDESRLAMLEMLETAAQHKHQGEMERLQVEHTMRLKESALEKMALLAPVLGNALTKRTPGGQEAAAIYAARTLFSSIRPEQLRAMLSPLDAAQQTLALSLFRTMAEEAERADSGDKKEPKNEPH